MNFIYGGAWRPHRLSVARLGGDIDTIMPGPDTLRNPRADRGSGV